MWSQLGDAIRDLDTVKLGKIEEGDPVKWRWKGTGEVVADDRDC